MKPIDPEFTLKQYHFKLLTREKDIAIFHRDHVEVGHPHFEVVRIRCHKEFVLMGKTYPPTEYYPSSYDWGRLGYTCQTRERAFARMTQMLGESV